MSKEPVFLSLSDNRLLPSLFGEQDKNLDRIEEKLDVTLSSRGNIISIAGNKENVQIAELALKSLYKRLEKGWDVDIKEVDAAVRIAGDNIKKSDSTKKKLDKILDQDEVVIKTPKRFITPHTTSQQQYIKSILNHEMVFVDGPAGTGKTYLAVAIAVSMFINHKVERIILSRPAVEAGEKLGFLPGDMKEKVDPYLRPLYDALYDMIPAEKILKYVENQEIEIAPLAFMRGRTLNNSFIILDEAQNCTKGQMQMFLTRLGEGSRMVITGDLSQIDLPKNETSGLKDAMHVLDNISEIGHVHFSSKDIVRHSLITKIVDAYNKNNNDPSS